MIVALLSLALFLAVPMPLGAQDMMGDKVFISIRHYDGIDPADLAEGERITREGFVPLISASDGFIAYYVVYPDDGTLAAINVFETREQALASNELAREFVVEYLAPLLPNPPLIVEGSVDIGFVEMLDGMADGDPSSLHASVRIYDGFEADDLDEFVDIVDDGFLPIMRETDGFFGYYLMNNGAGAVAAISIFDTEESALASNERERDFVAEYLTAYLPNNPLVTSGRVGIAVLADLNDGANLIDDRMMYEVFASIRVYDGVDPADQDEIARLTADGFLPILRDSDGFIAYFLLSEGDTLAAINAFETAEQAAASNAPAREFVATNLAPFLPNAPTIVQGPMDTGNFAALDDMMMVNDVTSLFASLRVYAEVDLTQRAQATSLVNSIFLPLQQETEGFWGYVRMHDGESRSAALSIYDSEENALAANELAAEFVAEYLTDRPDQVPLRVSGRVGIAALADLHDGANLIDDMMVDAVFASVRVYDGVDPGDQAEIARLVVEGLLPIMRESDGFVGYYLLPAGDMLAAVSLFETADQAAASTGMARDFVAGNLAPMLPNTPLIVEGTVEVSTKLFTDAFDESMTAEEMAMPLYALLAIYDGFDMTRLDVTVTLVESVLLPDLRDAGGLFSYHGISDGFDKAVALRIMDSEASLQLGSEIAADFVAAHLADWLPEDPLNVSGRLAVAATTDLYMGENLAAWAMMDDSVFASVRLYDGIDPADQEEIARLTDEGFLPIIRESDGFVGYFFLPAGEELATVSLFDSAQQASASNDAARGFIVENMAPLLPNAPRIFEGRLSMDYVAGFSDSGDHAGAGDLYASIRLYEGFDLAHFDEANDLAIAHLLPTLQDLGGLIAQFAFNDGEDTVLGISVFDSEEGSLAANDAGKAFTIEYLADLAPNPPTGVSGKLAIASLAEINMGENLVSSMVGE